MTLPTATHLVTDEGKTLMPEPESLTAYVVAIVADADGRTKDEGRRYTASHYRVVRTR